MTLHLLHGNFGLPGDWENCLPDGIQTHCWNLWEIRREDPEARTLSGFARWLNRKVETIRQSKSSDSPSPHILAGYSLGGRLGLQSIREAPHLWSCALFVSTHPGLLTPEEQQARLESDLHWGELCRSRPWEDVLSQWNSQAVLSSCAPGPSADLLLPWREEIASAFSDWSTGHQLLRKDNLAGTMPPSLWLAGAKDAKFVALAERAVEIKTKAHCLIVEGSGHRLLQEKPELIRRILQEMVATGGNPVFDPSLSRPSIPR